MKAAKTIFSVIILLLLASNLRVISQWSESRGVYDDICYLRQAHLFQRFGWLHGLDTSLARDDDGYLGAKLRSINFAEWNNPARVPCHTQTADGSKYVMTPPPGTGFVLSLFPEGFQVIPLYGLASVLIAGFALLAFWRAQTPRVLALAVVFGTLALYFMINPTKASYSMAPTMVLCALTGFLTARLFVDDRSLRLATIALIGLLLGLSASFRIANVLLSAGYFLFFGLAFLFRRNRKSFLQGLAIGIGFLVGILPVLAANLVNSGHPLVSAYGGQDTEPPRLDLAVLRAYLADTQFALILIVCLWTALLWRLADYGGVKRLALLVAGNLALNLSFFATHPVFTQYYTIPISMLTLWTVLFATILMRAGRPNPDWPVDPSRPGCYPASRHEARPMPDLSLTISPETASDAQVIERLHERTFGPGRFVLSAYRLREHVDHLLDLSFTARIGTLLVGSVRQLPICVGATPALMLGPLTVEPPFRSRGIGRMLLDRALAEATRQGHRLVLLVGDEPYYRRVGFKPVPKGRATMPGPVDYKRLLVAELVDDAFEGVSGPIGPDWSRART